MSKTIKQIADEIGVSKQAVFQKIKKEPLSTSLQGLMSTVDRKLVVSVDGENAIKRAFREKKCKLVDDNCEPKNVNQLSVFEREILLLQEQIQEKDRQIGEKDRQIERLQNENSSLTDSLRTTTEALQNTTESLKAAQALHAGTMKKQLEPPRSIGERLKDFFKKEKE